MQRVLLCILSQHNNAVEDVSFLILELGLGLLMYVLFSVTLQMDSKFLPSIIGIIFLCKSNAVYLDMTFHFFPDRTFWILLESFPIISALKETSFGHLKSKEVLSYGTRSVVWLLYYLWLDKVWNPQMYVHVLVIDCFSNFHGLTFLQAMKVCSHDSQWK